MKKLFLNIILYLVVMNLGIFLISGALFEFNIIINLVGPVLCALVIWGVTAKQEKRFIG